MFRILFLAWATCEIFAIVEPEANSTSMVFLFAVFLVSRFTEGYLYGTAASVIGIIIVNFFFLKLKFNLIFKQ